MVPVTLELAIGCGLLLRRRWGWLLGVATAVLFIVNGLHSIIFVRGEYVVIDALIHRLVLRYFARVQRKRPRPACPGCPTGPRGAPGRLAERGPGSLTEMCSPTANAHQRRAASHAFKEISNP